MSVPYHKQLDPNKQAGQVVHTPKNLPGLYLDSGEFVPAQELTLNDYIKRKTEEPPRITFKEWLKKSSFVEPDETVYCWLEDCWNAAIKHGKIS